MFTFVGVFLRYVQKSHDSVFNSSVKRPYFNWHSVSRSSSGTKDKEYQIPGDGQSRYFLHISISSEQWLVAIKCPGSHGLQYSWERLSAGSVPVYKIHQKNASEISISLHHKLKQMLSLGYQIFQVWLGHREITQDLFNKVTWGPCNPQWMEAAASHGTAPVE